MKKSDTLIPKEMIERSILLLRGHKVMLDRDLAVLYGVTTGALNQAVRRNLERFPKDFMFQLTPAEKKNWMSQIVISNREKMGIRHRPFAFTENGVAMLSSVLRSKKAVLVNIVPIPINFIADEIGAILVTIPEKNERQGSRSCAPSHDCEK
ncbi:MAG: ORF6N domain-containing protein [Candidatus Omnitrophota bacterium]